MEYLILVGGWFIYFLLHSMFALEKVKHGAAKMFGPLSRYYRLAYSVFSTTGLLGLVIFNAAIPSEYFIMHSGLTRYLSLMLTTFGVMAIQLSFRNYSLKGFLGFKEESHELKVNGILQYVRHPIYAGLILVTIGFFLFIPNLPTLISCACILIYLPFGIALEEKKLIATFGQDYLNYREKVPAIFPRLRLAK